MTVNLGGCASLDKLIQPVVPAKHKLLRQSTSSYVGPKARIIVADFETKAEKATAEISGSLRQMFVAALANSNRFFVAERQALNTSLKTQAEVRQEATKAGGRSPQPELGKSADLIIATTVTEFDPQASGGSAGIGSGGGVASGALGGLLGPALNRAHMALEIRIINVSTSAVLVSGKVQGQATDVSGGPLAAFTANGILSNGLSVYTNTPMEKAIRSCINEAVRYVTQAIPVRYYKY